MSNGFLSIRRSSLYAFIAYILFLLANYTYYAVFATDYLNYWIHDDYSDYFYFPLNLDQEKFYRGVIADFENNNFVALSSASGITYIYFFIGKIFGKITPDNVAFISFIFNNIFVIISYLYFVKIGVEVLRLPFRYRWLFFMNPSLIYFSQLIQKEMLSLAVVLALTYYLNKAKWLKFILAIIFSAIQRLHFLVIGPMAYFLTNVSGGYLIKMIILYITTSLIAGYQSHSLHLNQLSGASADGFTAFVLSVNNSYYVGHLLFNPIRFIQYFYDLFRSFNFILNDSRINLYNVHNIPYLIFLVFNWKVPFRILLNFRQFSRGPSRTILSVIIVYMFLILGSPIIHSRYLFPSSYLIILLVLYNSRQHMTKKSNATK
jgi:hypothetical protein